MSHARIGGYEIKEELGRGGMGVVYRAHDPALRRDVAIKLIHATDEKTRARFEREGQAMAQIRHPNVAAIHAVGEELGQPYIVMDLIEGESLGERLRRGPLAARETAIMGLTLARALGHVHGRGVLHRDIKPDNVLLAAGGAPVLSDFGLAKPSSPEVSSISQSGTYLGTPGYWSPEQALGRLDEIGPASDIFCLGATLYAALTQQPPFGGPTLLDTLVGTLEREPTPPSQLGDVYPALEQVILRCLRKDPTQRFPDGNALAEALASALEQESSGGGARLLAVVGGALAGATALGALWLALGQGLSGEPSPKASRAREQTLRDQLEANAQALSANAAELEAARASLEAARSSVAREEPRPGDMALDLRKAQKLIGEARELMRVNHPLRLRGKSELHRALAALDEAAALGVRSAEIQQLRAEAFLRQGELGPAREALKVAMEAAPGARLFYLRGVIDSAPEDLRRALAGELSLTEHMHAQAALALAEGDVDQAQRLGWELIALGVRARTAELKRLEPLIWRLLAGCQEKRGHDVAAARYRTRAASIDRKDRKAMEQTAEALWQEFLGRWDEGSFRLEDWQPDSEVVRKLDEAVADWTRALEILPKADWERIRGKRAVANRLRARVAARTLHDPTPWSQVCITDFSLLLRRNPNAGLRVQRGMTYSNLFEYRAKFGGELKRPLDLAVSDFEASLKLDPAALGTWNLLGESCYNRGQVPGGKPSDYERALEAYSLLIGAGGYPEGSGLGGNYLLRGHCLTRLNRGQAALRDYRRAVKLNPALRQQVPAVFLEQIKALPPE